LGSENQLHREAYIYRVQSQQLEESLNKLHSPKQSISSNISFQLDMDRLANTLQ